MAASEVKYEVDWDHDELYANANSDITSYVRNQKSQKWGTGRSGNSSLTSRSKAGKLTLPLLNSTGIFSSQLSSGALFGKLKAGRRCRVSLRSRAAQFTIANSEYLTGGDVWDKTTGDFSIAGTLYIDSLATAQGLVNKRDRASATNLGYAVELQTDGTLDFLISDGTSVTTISSTTVLAVDTFYTWIVTADRDGNAQFYINAGAAEGAASITTQAGTLANAIAFTLGAGNSGGVDRYFGGRMGPVAIWDKLLSSAERTWWHGQGNARKYTDGNRTGDGSTIRTSLNAWYELDEGSGTRVDAHASGNDLTDTNTVTDAAGWYNNLSWSGRVDAILPNSQVGRLAEAKLTAFGNLATVAAGNPRSTRTSGGTLTSAGIGQVLTDIGWSTDAGARDINTGQTSMDPWYFPASEKPSALKEIHKIEASEGMALFRESERDDVVFEDRHFRLSGARLTSRKTYSDDGTAGTIVYQKIPQQDPVQDVFNRITAKVPNQSLASLATLWTLGSTGASSPFIGPGETQRFIAHYPPEDTAGIIGAVWTTLVSGTDYTANSESDDTGTDLKGDLTITLTKALDIMVISILNGHATLGAYITKLQARGQGVQEGDLQEVESFDQTSIDDHGERPYEITAPFIPNIVEAMNQTRYVLALTKDIAPKMNISFLANRDRDHVKEAAEVRLSHRLTIDSDTATKLGIVSQDVFVEGIEHEIKEGVHTVSLSLSPVEKSGGGLVIVLDTGPGLDTGILGY